MNIVYNHDENRLRAGIRLIIYLFLFVIVSSPVVFVKNLSISATVLSLTLFAVTWFCVRQLDIRPLSGVGLKVSRKWAKEYILGLAIGFIVQTIIFLIEWQSGWLEITGFAWNRPDAQFWLWPIFLVLVRMLGVGFYEELMFRGYLIRNMSEGFTMGFITPKNATYVAVILSSSLFGLAHITNPAANWVSTINIIMAGLVLAFPFILTGRLGLSIGIHSSWNFVMGGIYGLPVSGLSVQSSLIQVRDVGPIFMTGGKFGPEAGITGIIGMVLIIIMVYYLQKMTGGKPAIHSSFTVPYQKIVKNHLPKDELA